MDREESWRTIRAQRLSLADLLEGLTDAQWDATSLCTDWRVRDVAAHVAVAPQVPGLSSMLADAVHARGSFNRLNHDVAVRHAARPVTQIVAELREHAGSRRLPVVTNYRNILFDILVHGQDIAVPLGLRCDTATDTTWAVGNGADVRGPIDALLMLLTGRPAAIPRLAGDGLPDLTERLRRNHRGRNDPPTDADPAGDPAQPDQAPPPLDNGNTSGRIRSPVRHLRNEAMHACPGIPPS